MAVFRNIREYIQKKSFTCEVCFKKFRTSSKLKSHQNIHTGEKPYICQVCSKGFTHNSSLQVHRRTQTGERPFTCEVCSNRFRTSSNLKSHQMIHTGPKHVKIVKRKLRALKPLAITN